MALINFTGIEAGNWTVLAEDEQPTEGAKVAASVTRIADESEEFFAAVGELGAVVSTETAYADLAPLLNKLSFVAIEFPAFTDGRGFSLAVRLRKDLGFKGEIRAVGPVMPDQAMHLMRSGFDTVDVADERKEAFEACAARFKQFYQSDYRGAVSIAHARHSSDESRKAS
ncbi:DUF934 domain-containing protein [Kordiimonas laminariae]|uniref:DUF934 domain-containing protein n=1 Tax=Kordiimonas laminariae TaxID=2917717 RepID=UPI001FF65BF2|nr:DUF934 domain-containing protein [Kordiimonas laminariae]MCK0069067.1 DUF934 domain-containing protein [Kordiimonas laminariae]